MTLAVLALAACSGSDAPLAQPADSSPADSGPELPSFPPPERSRYSGCSVTIVDARPSLDLVDRITTITYDESGWEAIEQVDWGGNGVVDATTTWSGRNPWGLYETRKDTYLDEPTATEEGTYSAAFWLTRNRAYDGWSEIWTYDQPTLTRFTAQVEESDGSSFDWKQVLDGAHVVDESETDEDGNVLYEDSYAYDGARLVSADHVGVMGTEHDEWQYGAAENAPYQEVREWWSEGELLSTTSIRLDYDSTGRETSSYAISDAPYSPDEEITWTWTCPT